MIRQKQERIQQNTGRRELELYLHVPFCVRKCAYCDFLSAPGSPARQEAYFHALQRELANFPGKDAYHVSSVFFGGGTPSLWPGAWIGQLLEQIADAFSLDADAEISLECNPGTADAQKLRAYRAAGVNRLSLGLQSADHAELAALGRIHTWEDFQRIWEAARGAGFANINVDLMSALPGQNVTSWERTLRRVTALRPEHISAYSLIIEEGTPFFARYHEDALRREQGEQPLFLPSEEEEREMYRLTEILLGETGLRRYEISNYALPGRECRHNIGYWRGTEYAGFGLGASSLLYMLEFGCPDVAQRLKENDRETVGETFRWEKDNPVSVKGLEGNDREIVKGLDENSQRATERMKENSRETVGEAFRWEKDNPVSVKGLEENDREIAERLDENHQGVAGRMKENSQETAGGMKENIPRTAPKSESALRWLRLRNPQEMEDYLEGDFSKREVLCLTQQDRMEEFMFLGLRMTDGVSEQEFASRFGCPVDQIYGEVLQKLCGQKLLVRRAGRIALSGRGLDLSNLVMAEFLL